MYLYHSEQYFQIRDLAFQIFDQTGLDNHVIIPVSILDMPLLFNEETSLSFAILQGPSATLLTELEDKSHATLHLFCEVRCDTPSKKARNTGAKIRSPDSSVSLHAIIYGSSQAFESVGDFLQQSAIYLQDPPLNGLTAPYRNPHRLQQVTNPTDFLSGNGSKAQLFDIKSLDKSIDPFAKLEYAHSLQEAAEPLALVTPLYR